MFSFRTLWSSLATQAIFFGPLRPRSACFRQVLERSREANPGTRFFFFSKFLPKCAHGCFCFSGLKPMTSSTMSCEVVPPRRCARAHPVAGQWFGGLGAQMCRWSSLVRFGPEIERVWFVEQVACVSGEMEMEAKLIVGRYRFLKHYRRGGQAGQE